MRSRQKISAELDIDNKQDSITFENKLEKKSWKVEITDGMQDCPESKDLKARDQDGAEFVPKNIPGHLDSLKTHKGRVQIIKMEI